MGASCTAFVKLPTLCSTVWKLKNKKTKIIKYIINNTTQNNYKTKQINLNNRQNNNLENNNLKSFSKKTYTELSLTFFRPWLTSSVISFHTVIPNLRFKSEAWRVFEANTVRKVLISSSTRASS